MLTTAVASIRERAFTEHPGMAAAFARTMDQAPNIFVSEDEVDARGWLAVLIALWPQGGAGKFV